MRRFFQAAAIVAVVLFMTVASASASVIYSTNAAGTLFVGGGLTLNSAFGAAATLTYTPDVSVTVGVPSNIDFGKFTLACAACSTQAQGAGAFFNAFTFDLIVTDTTDSVTGEFVGTSTGGQVYSNASLVNITWSPLQLGPGTSGVLTGTSFGTTFFQITSPTGIVAPNTGGGVTTVQGYVNAASGVPEPTTFVLLGAGLLGLGALRRKRA